MNPVLLIRISLILACTLTNVCVNNLLANGPRTADTSARGEHLTEAQQLANQDPQRDFEVARQKGDIYFLGVMGFVVDVPGIEDGQRSYLKRVRVKVIEGTSDVLGPGQDREVRKKVRAYAEKYNKLVLQFLKESEAKEHTRQH